MKLSISARESRLVTFTDKITRLEWLYSCQACWKAGISALHGGHQLAQKLRMMGWPLRSARVIELPATVPSVKFGARKFVLGASMFIDIWDEGGIREPSTQARSMTGRIIEGRNLRIFM